MAWLTWKPFLILAAIALRTIVRSCLPSQLIQMHQPRLPARPPSGPNRLERKFKYGNRQLQQARPWLKRAHFICDSRLRIPTARLFVETSFSWPGTRRGGAHLILDDEDCPAGLPGDARLPSPCSTKPRTEGLLAVKIAARFGAPTEGQWLPSLGGAPPPQSMAWRLSLRPPPPSEARRNGQAASLSFARAFFDACPPWLDLA